MAGYKLQGKTASGAMVDIPLAATYDAAGNNIQQHYAAKTEYEAIMAKLGIMGGQLDLLLASSGMVSFADCDWTTIKAISESGKASEAFKVGDEKSITLSTGEKITMVILGFDHDNLSDGSGKAGITLGMKNALATNYMMNGSSKTYDGQSGYNAGGWLNCEMRNNTMPMLLSYLPTDVQAVIKSVKKLTSKGCTLSDMLETNDKLFLFSQEEVFGTHKYSTTGQNSFAGEGTQYEYFKGAPIPTPKSGTAGAFSVLEGTGCFYTTDTALAQKYDNRFGQEKSTSKNYYYNYNNAKAQGDSATTSCSWWLRSPYYDGSGTFCCVSGGGYCYGDFAGGSIGVAFGFCV